MKGMKKPTEPKKKLTTEHATFTPIVPKKHEMMMRREPNHNVHVITAHGKIQAGRKGRSV
ncbi:hypothetical protein [Geomonas sp. Red276]